MALSHFRNRVMIEFNIIPSKMSNFLLFITIPLLSLEVKFIFFIWLEKSLKQKEEDVYKN